MNSFIDFYPTAAASAAPTPIETWVICPDCGQAQNLPQHEPHCDRTCIRCNASFGSGTSRTDTLLALSIAMVALFILVNIAPLLGIYIEGRHNSVTVAAAAHGLFKAHSVMLGTFVSALTVIMPLTHMLLQIYVLSCLRLGLRPPNLARIFLWSERVRPWAMLDVFLLALFITVNKMRDMAQVELMPSLWALACLIGLFLIFGTLVDRRKIWNSIQSQVALPMPQNTGWVDCHACGMLHNIGRDRFALKRSRFNAKRESLASEKKMDRDFSTIDSITQNHDLSPRQIPADAHCLRCHSPLHHRKPNSIQRTWALVLAGFALYIPANLYPVMLVVTLGQAHPTTILGGVRQLWNGSDWPYAILLFCASIVIPMFKLIGLTGFLLTFHLRQPAYLMHCTKLYRLFDLIGRWSMLDIFVAALLGALIDFGNLANSMPGPGLLPFAGVVVLTMLAVSSFDPRLMWDAAETKND